MKKVLTIALAVCFLFGGVTAAFAAEPAVFVDGEELISDTPAVIKEGRTLLPMRAVFEALDQKVDWDNESKTVTSGDIILKIDEKEAVVAGEVYELDVPATLIENRTYVPLRFVAETLGKTVDWDNDAKRVDILSEEEAVDEEAVEEEAAEEEAVEEEAAVDEEADEEEAAEDEAATDGEAEDENGADDTEAADDGENEEE